LPFHISLAQRQMNPLDMGGIVGVGLVLLAYAGAAFGKLNPENWPSLACNLIGSLLILWSLTTAFNLSAALMEGSWALVAGIGLLRAVFRER
jgi:hypothetical protein